MLKYFQFKHQLTLIELILFISHIIDRLRKVFKFIWTNVENFRKQIFFFDNSFNLSREQFVAELNND